MKPDRPTLPLLGGVLAAVGSSLCCAGPLVLLMLGLGGSWVSALTALEPYRPLFLLLVVGLLGWAGWQLYRPVAACPDGAVCALPDNRRRYRQLFWLALSLALALAASPYWIPRIA